MSIAKVLPELCILCEECTANIACPVHIIKLDAETGERTVDRRRCLGCGRCARFCKGHAIKYGK